MGNLPDCDREIVNKQITDNKVFVVGNNDEYQLGLNNNEPCKNLISIKHKNISNIYSGARYTIYANLEFQSKHKINHNNKNKNKNQNKTIQTKQQKFYSCGYNEYGECCMSNFETNISKISKIKYFRKKNIKIRKICCSSHTHSIFWISSNHRVFASGRNSIHGRLGIGDTNHRNQPEEITFFKDLYQIIDIQTANNFSIALCKLNITAFIKIIYKWSQYLTLIPLDIIIIVKLFYDNTNNKIFITKPQINPKLNPRFAEFAGFNEKPMITNDWKFVKAFKKRQIIKISTGDGFAVFLKSNGTIFGLGKNERGQLGLGHNKDINKKPMKLEYFVIHKIRIRHIKCGGLHCLAIDNKYRLYGWGYNYYGQLGIKSDCNDVTFNDHHVPDIKGINVPILNKYFYDLGLGVIAIQCGYYHSYVRVKNFDNDIINNYLFGSNQYNECLTFNDKIKVFEPWCIDHIIRERTFGTIKNVSLGFENTKIIIERDDDYVCCVVPDFNMTRYGL